MPVRAASGALLLALLLGLLLLAAPRAGAGPSGAAAPRGPVVDPGGAGPHAVGTARRAVGYAGGDGRARELPVALWFPGEGERPAPGRHPLVVFSHGGDGSPEEYGHLLGHLASHGFVVAAPLHDDPPAPPAGSDCLSCRPVAELLRASQLRRVDDVSATLDALLDGSDPLLGSAIDPTRVGVAGHSRGGHTALRVLESDRRVLAGLTLAPATSQTPAIEPGKVGRPAMLVAGEWDLRVPYGAVGRFFESIPAAAPDRWFVGIRRAGHAFGSACRDATTSFRPCGEMLAQEEVNGIARRWGTAFLLRHVGGDARYDAFLDPGAAGADAVVARGTAGSGTPAPPVPTPLPGGEATVRQAIEYVCRAGRPAACAQLRSGGVAVQFAPLAGVHRFVPAPGLITLDAAYANGPVSEVASFLVGAASYVRDDFYLRPSCDAIARAETEQARIWSWQHPTGIFPADTPRALRMLQIVTVTGVDGSAQVERDPARDFASFVPC